MASSRRFELPLALSLVLSVLLPASLSAQVAAPPLPALGPQAVKAPVDLLKDVKWDISSDVIKAEFTVDDPAGILAMELASPANRTKSVAWALNDHEISRPIAGMTYVTLPCIDANYLRKGPNVLWGKGRSLSASIAKSTSLAALRSEHVNIRTGPVLGAFGDDFFTVTFRSNVPATAQVTATPAAGADADASAGKKVSPEVPFSTCGVYRVKVPRDPAVTAYKYEIALRIAGVTATFAPTTAVLPSGVAKDKLHFIAMGDNRTNREDWAKVAAAAIAAKPELVLHTGDLVESGPLDWLWDQEFYAPAAGMLSSAPLYVVFGNHETKTPLNVAIGNHEDTAPLLNDLFYMPTEDGRGRNWTQTVGPVMFIGIDGAEDFAPGSAHYKWLEDTLAASKAKFIFLASHYPGWTSSTHGKLNLSGKPSEAPVRQAQEVILPLLAKYKATAMISGHDHCYERSDPPGGVTMIVSGGAGAPRYPKSSNGEKQNPYSKVYISDLNYCVFDADADACTMKAVIPDGKQIDSLTWKAR